MRTADGSSLVEVGRIGRRVSILFHRGTVEVELIVWALPRVAIRMGYGDWKRVVAQLLVQREQHEAKRAAHECLVGVTSDHLEYSVLADDEFYLKIGAVPPTGEERRTGVAEDVVVRVDKTSIRFDRNSFLRFRDGVLEADRKIGRRIGGAGRREVARARR